MNPSQRDPQSAATVEAAPQTFWRRVAASRLWRAEVRYGVALTIFAALALFAHAYAYFAWDRAFSRAVQSLHAPGLEAFMYAVSYPGYGIIPYALAAATCAIFLLFNRRSEAFGLLLSTAGSGLLNHAFKLLIARPRPAAPDVNIIRKHGGQSFPSGHVTFYVCYFGFLFFVAYALLPQHTYARRLALTLTASMVFLVGLSRIYLGAHWPSDTLGAYFFGGLWLALSLHFYRRMKTKG